MTTSFARNAIVLGLLSAIGPFAIDMYLPALPAIAADLHASTAATQMTLMVFFVSFGVCQIFYGPISDMSAKGVTGHFSRFCSSSLASSRPDCSSGTASSAACL